MKEIQQPKKLKRNLIALKFSFASKIHVISVAIWFKQLRKKAFLSSGVTLHVFAQLIMIPYATISNAWFRIIFSTILLHIVFPQFHVLFHLSYTRQLYVSIQEMHQPQAFHFWGKNIWYALGISYHCQLWDSRVNYLSELVQYR